MEYRDKTLVCVECHQSFIWTAGEQLFYHDKNFKNEPKRCKECKAKRNARMGQPPRERVETMATCSQCGTGAGRGHSVDSRRDAVIAYGLFVNDSAARRKPP